MEPTRELVPFKGRSSLIGMGFELEETLLWTNFWIPEFAVFCFGSNEVQHDHQHDHQLLSANAGYYSSAQSEPREQPLDLRIPNRVRPSHSWLPGGKMIEATNQNSGRIPWQGMHRRNPLVLRGRGPLLKLRTHVGFDSG